MHVLVTGNTGYIGPVVTEVFQNAGHTVTGLDVDLFGGCDLFPPAAADRQIVADVRTVGPEVLDGIDAIVHLAALSNDPLGALDQRLTTDINQIATMRLARMAKEAGVSRFVFSSSCSAYGRSEKDWVSEDDEPEPLTEYAVSKVAVEGKLQEMADASFVPVMLRNATAFGLSPRMRFDLVLNQFVAWAVTTGQIRIMSDGTPWRPLVHIRDIAKACLIAAESDPARVSGQIVNIGANEQNYRVKDIASTVERVVPGCEVVYTGEHGPDSRSYRVRFDRLAKILPEFSCDWDIERSAVEIRDAIVNAQLTEAGFQDSRFIRLTRLQELMASGSLNADLYWRDGPVTHPAV